MTKARWHTSKQYLEIETPRSVSSGQHEVGIRQVVEWLTNPSNEDGALWVLRKLREDYSTLWYKAQHEGSLSWRSQEESSVRSPRLMMPVERELSRPDSLFETDEANDEMFALLDDDYPQTRRRSGSAMLSTTAAEWAISVRSSSQFRASAFFEDHALKVIPFVRPPLPDEIAEDGTPVLMFNDSIYLSHEEQGVVRILVLRVGDTSSRSKVRWFTRDASAHAGQTYCSSGGTLCFEPGVRSLAIEVMLIPNELWDSILDFKVCLAKDGLVNGILDKYLHEASVKVFNDDPFPTNEYQELLQAGRAEAVPPFALIRSYIATNCRNREIWIRTVKGIIVDQLHNMVFCAGLFMQVYLIDCALDLKHPQESLFMQSRAYTLFLLVGARLIPNSILHFLDYRFVKFSTVVGPSRAMVQSALLRHYFYCLETCRSSLGFTGLLMAMSHDTDTVAEDVYKIASKVPMHIGKLIAICAFQLGAPFVFGTTMKPFPLIAMLAFPVMMGFFLACRQKKTNTLLSAFIDKNVSFCRAVGQIAENFQMITTFAKQDMMESTMAEKVKDRNTAANTAGLCVFNNEYFANWVTLLVLCAYTVVGGLNVIGNKTSVGYFVTTLSMFQQMGAIWSNFFHDVVKVQAAVPALMRIANFLNMPSDLEEREEAKRRGKILQHGDNIDEYPIVLRGFEVHLTGTPCADGETINLQQGNMIAITSQRAGGKTTLLRLLGRIAFPAAGADVDIHVPSHLRVLHVSSIPFFFYGTLATNLSFGMKDEDPDRYTVRMLSICKSLGLSTSVLDFLEHEEVSKHWQQVLSESDCHLLSIARALIATPDVLCLEKPTAKLDDDHSSKVLDTLRQFVVRKGLGCAFPERCRRPRTVMYTSERVKAVKCSDVVIFVHPDGRVQEFFQRDFRATITGDSPLAHMLTRMVSIDE